MNEKMDYEEIRYEVEDGRARITLEGRAPRSARDDLTDLGGTKRPGHRTGRSHDDVWLIEQCNRRICTFWEMHKPSIAQVHGRSAVVRAAREG